MNFMNFMKFKNTKNLLIASTSVVLVASVAVVSTVFQDNEVSFEKEAGSVKDKNLSNEKSGEDGSSDTKSLVKEVDEKEEKEEGSKGEETPVSNDDVEEGSEFKGSSTDEVSSSKSPETTTASKVTSTQKSSEKAEVTAKTPTKEKVTSQSPAKESPASKEESKPVKQPAQEVINMEEKNYETTASLNMRSTSSVSGTLLASIPKGTQVKSSQKQNNWFKVNYANKTGWVSSSYLQEVKSKSETSPVVSAPPAKEEPVTKPVTKPAPAPVVQKLMSRAQAEAHVSKHVNKAGYGYNLKSGSGRTSIIVEFPTSGSGKAQMSVDGVNYFSAVDIQPGDFGQQNYDEAKAHLAQMDGAIKAYAETQFGIGSKETNTLIAEIKKMTLANPTGQVKKLTLQGVTITLAQEGVSTSVYY